MREKDNEIAALKRSEDVLSLKIAEHDSLLREVQSLRQQVPTPPYPPVAEKGDKKTKDILAELRQWKDKCADQSDQIEVHNRRKEIFEIRI